jgi:hypothetical protein
MLAIIKEWYDGYTWDGKTAVYNPYSTLLVFDTQTISCYWFTSGTPTFLIEQLKKRDQIDLVFEPVVASSKTFDSFDPNNIDNIALMFQTGYLTIKAITLNGIVPQYTLGVPNQEVQQSILEHLVSLFSYYPLDQVEPLVNTMSNQLQTCDSEGFAQSVRTMLANIPYNIQIGNEKYYHSLFLSWMHVLGFKAHGEILTGSGRIDAVLEQPDTIIVSELKYHAKTKTGALLRQAIKQIYDKKYYEKYLDKGKKIVLLGLAFSGKEVGCRMEELKNR